MVPPDPSAPPIRPWFAIWTRSRHEKVVHEQLARKEVESFLPTIPRWTCCSAAKFARLPGAWPTKVTLLPPATARVPMPRAMLPVPMMVMFMGEIL